MLALIALIICSSAAATDARVRALILPKRHATLASRLQATIERIGPDNGDRFLAGDVLVAFDCTGFAAELARAVAASDAARDTVTVKEELARSGAASRLQAVLARAEAKRANADVAVMQNQVTQCTIRAPYAGRVVKRVANANETVGFRDPLMEIVGDDSFEVRAFVPSAWARSLVPGARFQVTIDETGASVEAEVVALAAWIDNISQLMEVRGRVVSETARLTAGMSGMARFADAPEVLAGASPAPAPESTP